MDKVTNGATRPGSPKNTTAGRLTKIATPKIPLTPARKSGLIVTAR